MKKNNYWQEIESRIQGIPCLIGVVNIDHEGYVNYDILDRKGYKAAWLERKMTIVDEIRVDSDIAQWALQDEDYFDDFC